MTAAAAAAAADAHQLNQRHLAAVQFETTHHWQLA
jgi:hypothetical protein